MADIFLSYKREDREKVRPLAEALEGKGWSVQWDTRIGVGEAWDQVIETELAAAKCIPQDAHAYFNRGATYEWRKSMWDKRRAIADFRKALEIDPTRTNAKEGLRRLEAAT